MRILFLTPAEVDDVSFGGGLRSHALRTSLEQVGEVHSLVIHGAPENHLDTAWSDRKVKRATFNSSGSSIGTVRQKLALRAWVAAIVREQPWDVIVARYVGLAVLVPRGDWGRLVLDADDIGKKPPGGSRAPFAVRARIGLRNAIARLVVRRVRHAWIVNPADFETLRSNRTSLLGNVVPVPARERSCLPAVPGRILMVGYLEHPPNAEGLSWFVERVLPRLAARFADVELHAVGKHAQGFDARFASPVRLKGFVADLSAEYDEASLVIAPILSGGGTQIKVLDALAHARPLVASTFSHAGFRDDLRDKEHLLVADGEDEWVERCSEVLARPAEAEALARRGHAVVRAAYGTERMAVSVRQTMVDLGFKRASA